MLLSDETSKHDVREFDPEAALRAINKMKIKKWRYNFRPDEEQVGVMAQNWHNETMIGDGLSIPTVSAVGYLMASVQALSKKVEELETRLASKQEG